MWYHIFPAAIGMMVPLMAIDIVMFYSNSYFNNGTPHNRRISEEGYDVYVWCRDMRIGDGDGYKLRLLDALDDTRPLWTKDTIGK